MDNYSKNSEDVDDSQLELIETVDHEVLRGNSPKSLDPITEN